MQDSARYVSGAVCVRAKRERSAVVRFWCLPRRRELSVRGSTFFRGEGVLTASPQRCCILHLRYLSVFLPSFSCPCSLFSVPLFRQPLIARANGGPGSTAGPNLPCLSGPPLGFGERKIKWQENLGSQSLERVGNREVGV